MSGMVLQNFKTTWAVLDIKPEKQLPSALGTSYIACGTKQRVISHTHRCSQLLPNWEDLGASLETFLPLFSIPRCLKNKIAAADTNTASQWRKDSARLSILVAGSRSFLHLPTSKYLYFYHNSSSQGIKESGDKVPASHLSLMRRRLLSSP